MNVVSVAHRRGALDFKDLNADKEYSPVEAYNNSQLANMVFTMELARRLKGEREGEMEDRDLGEGAGCACTHTAGGTHWGLVTAHW